MRVAVVKGVVALHAGGEAAGFAAFREREDVEVRIRLAGGVRLRGVVVAKRGPEDGGAKLVGVDVEDGALVFRVRARVVGQITECQHHGIGQRFDEVGRSVCAG